MITKVSSDLFKASRPGWPAKKVGASVVQEWIREVRERGIKTIVCLLDPAQLDYYLCLGPGGLLQAYRDAGFEVLHHPVQDHQRPPVPNDVLQSICRDLQSCPKPVLVHCSAGADRTGAVISYARQGPFRG